MSITYKTTRRVEFADTDAAGIMHFSRFFTMMEEVEHEFLRQLGLSILSHDEQGKISWPRVAAKCDYLAAVKFEELVQIELNVKRIGTKSITYGFIFSRDVFSRDDQHSESNPLAIGELTSVCCRLSEDHSPKSIEIPTNFLKKLQT